MLPALLGAPKAVQLATGAEEARRRWQSLKVLLVPSLMLQTAISTAKARTPLASQQQVRQVLMTPGSAALTQAQTDTSQKLAKPSRVRSAAPTSVRHCSQPTAILTRQRHRLLSPKVSHLPQLCTAIQEPARLKSPILIPASLSSSGITHFSSAIQLSHAFCSVLTAAELVCIISSHIMYAGDHNDGYRSIAFGILLHSMAMPVDGVAQLFTRLAESLKSVPNSIQNLSSVNKENATATQGLHLFQVSQPNGCQCS